MPRASLNLRTRSRLGGAGRADEQQRLLGDGGDAHQVDELLLVDEEAAQRRAEAVDPLAQVLGLGLEVREGEVIGVRGIHDRLSWPFRLPGAGNGSERVNCNQSGNRYQPEA